MARFGGNEFTGFSVPLTFEGRYFILEPGEIPQLTVLLEKDGEPVLEILKNKPVDNPITNVSLTAARIVTVSSKETGKFLYKKVPLQNTSRF